MKEYFKYFIKNEDGGELIEYAIIIAIVAVLGIAVFNIASIAENKITGAGEAIAGIGPDANNATPADSSNQEW